jgi:hypothetical protein
MIQINWKKIKCNIQILLKKKNMITWTFPKWHIFIWSVRTLLKFKWCQLLHPRLLYFFPNLWNVINKFNSIFLINAIFFMKKIQDYSINFKKLMIYHTNTLCHHTKHTLLYLWLKYGTIWTNIVNHVEFILINLWNGT